MRCASSFLLFASILAASTARSETALVCSAAVDAATGATIVRQGSCETRVTAASTFKIAISLMGFDAGILRDAHTPMLPFKDGYADWREDWKQSIDPASWMAKSVVWYSQQVTQALGEKQFQDYVAAFRYGNENVSGDPGKHNGLTKAWLSSSLQISPDEQLVFLRKLANRSLPVSGHAMEMAASLLDQGTNPGGWRVYGKTGAGMAMNADGTPLKGRPYGWFVGWAVMGDRIVVFVQLIQDSERQTTSPGLRAKEAIMKVLFSTSSKL